jgi:hypothetical protein
LAALAGPGVLCVTAIGLGLFLRLWLLTNTPLNSDEAVIGLMAKQALHGHVTTFYWGQTYGGIEPFVVTALFAPFGVHAWVVKVAPLLLTIGGLIVLWRLGRRIFGPGLMAAAVVVLAWVWPESNMRMSVAEYGFRGVVWVLGLVVLLCVVRISSGSRRRADWVVLGAAAGLGCWAGPEILYFLAPAAIVLGGWIGWRPPRRRRTMALDVVVMAGAGLLGALPWLYTNISLGWPSLDVSSHYLGGSYPGRLHIFFAKALPIILGTRTTVTGTWLGGAVGPVVYVLLGVVVVGAAVYVALRVPLARILVLFLATFPFLYAVFPTEYWRDGRFAFYLPPIAALTVFGAGRILLQRRVGRPRTRLWLGTGMAAVVLVLASVSTVQSLELTTDFARRPYPLTGHGPETVPTTVVTALNQRGITHLFANYWVAYALDFIGGGSVTVTPPDAVRSHSIYKSVVGARHSAWLFAGSRPDLRASVQAAFESDQVDPYELTMAQFTATLSRGHVPFATVPVGAMTAVVPSVPVTPRGLYSLETRGHL